VQITLRPYRADEFEASAEIREITDEVALQRWRTRVINSGKWDDHYFHLAIEYEGKLVGDLQVRHCNQTMPQGTLELGIDVQTQVRGRGIGTEVLRLAASKFFAEGAHRISASTDSENKAMIRAFQKAGWNHEGTLIGLFKIEGKLHNYESFSITN
jgi:RimJ/RimL family protein N-acetyltransferase